MATVVIQKRKGQGFTSYAVRYKDPSTRKTRYYNTYRKRREAQQAANELRALIDLGKLHQIKKNKAKLNLLTFAEVSRMLKKQWEHKLEDKQLEKKTVDEYLIRLNLLQKVFGRRLLHEITKEEILTYRKEEALNSSTVTSNRTLFVVKQVFKVGLEICAISEDPTKDVRYLSEESHKRNNFLLPDTLKKLAEASSKTKAKHYMPALIFLGAEHGASKQEVLSLKWSDINFDYHTRGLIRFFPEQEQ